jgi:hypothetical protein
MDLSDQAANNIEKGTFNPQQEAVKAANATATTPAWVIRTIAVVVVAVSPFLAHWSIFSKNPTAAQAAVVVVCLVIAGLIFTVQVVLAAVHEYGFSRAALGDVATEERKEITVLAPDIESNWAKAEPIVNETVPKLSSDMEALTQRVAALEAEAKK